MLQYFFTAHDLSLEMGSFPVNECTIDIRWYYIYYMVSSLMAGRWKSSGKSNRVEGYLGIAFIHFILLKKSIFSKSIFSKTNATHINVVKMVSFFCFSVNSVLFLLTNGICIYLLPFGTDQNVLQGLCQPVDSHNPLCFPNGSHIIAGTREPDDLWCLNCCEMLLPKYCIYIYSSGLWQYVLVPY